MTASSALPAALEETWNYLLTNPTFNIPSHFWRNFRNCVCIIGLFCCMMMWWPKKFYYCFYGIVFLDMAGLYHAFLSSPAVFNAIYSNSTQGYAIHCVVGANHIWNWMGNNYRLKSFILRYTQLVKVMHVLKIIMTCLNFFHQSVLSKISVKMVVLQSLIDLFNH